MHYGRAPKTTDNPALADDGFYLSIGTPIVRNREPWKRGEAILQTLYHLASYYPIGTTFREAEKDDRTFSITPPTPETFATLDGARIWSRHALALTRSLSFDWRRYESAIKEAVDAYQQHRQAEMERLLTWPEEYAHIRDKARADLSPGQREDEKRTMFQPTPWQAVDAYLRVMNRAEELARSIQADVRKLDSYQERAPKKPLMLTVLVLWSLTFSMSVLLPLWSQGPPRWCVVHTPSVFYAACLLGLGWLVAP